MPERNSQCYHQKFLTNCMELANFKAIIGDNETKEICAEKIRRSQIRQGRGGLVGWHKGGVRWICWPSTSVKGCCINEKFDLVFRTCLV